MPNTERRSAVSTWSHPKAAFAQEVPMALFNIQISKHTREHMKALKTELRGEKNSWNVIGYFNHTAFGDPALWAYAARSIDPEATHALAILASDYHIQFKNNPAFATLAHLGSFLAGIRLIPTLQTYMIDNVKYGYTKENAEQNAKEILRTIQQMKKPLILLVSPEGHRSDDGKLGDMESGFVSLGKRLAPTLFVPFGIYYEGEFNRDGINSKLSQYHPLVHIEMGEITYQPDRTDKPPLGELVGKLANALPPSLRGQWFATSPGTGPAGIPVSTA